MLHSFILIATISFVVFAATIDIKLRLGKFKIFLNFKFKFKFIVFENPKFKFKFIIFKTSKSIILDIFVRKSENEDNKAIHIKDDHDPTMII